MLSRSRDGINSLNWDLNADEIHKQADDLISFANQGLKQIVDQPEKNFQNIVFAFDNLLGDVEDWISRLRFPASVSTDADVRNASSEVLQKLSQYIIELYTREDLFNAFREVSQNKVELDDIENKLLKEIIRDFIRNGLELEKDKREKYIELSIEASKIAIQFRQTLNEVTDTVFFSKEELDGVPDNVVDNFKKDEKGNFVVGMSYPEVFPILDFGNNPMTRKKIAVAFGNRAIGENVERLEKIVAIRHEAANILGFNNHASYILDTRLARDPIKVNEFLTELEAKLKQHTLNDIAELEKLKVELEKNSDGQLKHYDRRYYERIYKEKNFQLDKEEIKKYFPIKKVVHEMLLIYQEILGLIFEQVDNIESWHEDVTTFEVYDKESNIFLGVFYLDLFPRDGKYNHAAASSLISGRTLENGMYQATASAMMANFNKPTPDAPSLLSHEQVQTLFHEFGHVMHHVITTSSFSRFSGSSVKRDFVEAPSQILENWAWEPEILKRISSHYQTGSPMPDDLIQKMLDAKYVLSSIQYLAQIFYAKYDQLVHTSSKIDSKQKWHELYETTTTIPALNETNPAASFGHLMGYDAGYYGYLWAEVFSHDMYTKFKEIGILSPEIGKLFRKWILEPGGSKDEMYLMESFLGRKVSDKAFVKNVIGID